MVKFEDICNWNMAKAQPPNHVTGPERLHPSQSDRATTWSVRVHRRPTSTILARIQRIQAAGMGDAEATANLQFKIVE